jgi:hypothetical protein
MEPIDTEFRGDLFRSRTEARWAVFFSEVEEEYKYEPQGFNLNGTSYLPDFWLPDLEIWVEVKPDRDYTLEELQKAQLLSEESRSVVAVVCGQPRAELDEVVLGAKSEKIYSTGHTIDLFLGPVWDRVSNERVKVQFVDGQWEWIADHIREAFRRRDVVFDGTEESVRRMKELYPDFLEYRGEDRSEWETKWERRKRYSGYVWYADEQGLGLQYAGRYFVDDETRPIVNALRAAQQARFEHGESGKPSDFKPI